MLSFYKGNPDLNTEHRDIGYKYPSFTVKNII